MIQPMMLRLSKVMVAIGPAYASYSVLLPPDDSKWRRPSTSGKVTSAARMHPQNTSWCATHRARDRRRMNPWAMRLEATRPGRAAALAPRRPRVRKACHPRRLSMAVGGRRNQTR